MTHHINAFQGQIDYATEKDTRGIEQLESSIYTEDWLVPSDFQERVLNKNRYTDRVLHTPSGIKGVYSFFALDKNTYEKVLSGDIDEKDLPNYLLDYDSNKDVYLYVATIIVDIHDTKNRKDYTKALIRDIPSHLGFIKSKNVNIKEIGAIAITPNGFRICERIGFKYDTDLKYHGTTNKVMRASLRDIHKNIDLRELTNY